MNISNPYNNVDGIPPQPYGSVVDTPLLTETAGLNSYNFLDVGNELNAYNDLQRVHRSAFPPNRTNEMNIDTTNVYYPHLQPLFYLGAASNYSLLNNPHKNVNYDESSARTYIKPYYSTREVYGSQLPIEANDSKIQFGPVYIEKTILSPN